ncbi:lysostaphin resistance A-like protein [Gemmatimonadota bacterium]
MASISQLPAGDDNSSALATTPDPAWIAPIYLLLYLSYLFWHQESELGHWISLVTIPLLLVLLTAVTFGEGGGSRGLVRRVMRSVGLVGGRWRRGLFLALALGVLIGFYQMFASRWAEEILDILRSGEVLWRLPLAFVLMAMTAGFTEEFFFRGFLQTRLEALTGSRPAGLLLASVSFGVFHLPYAFFNPNWPSAGEWGAAWGAALVEGVPGGLVLGGLYLVSGRNLWACIILHALINAVPGMTMLRFG